MTEASGRGGVWQGERGIVLAAGLFFLAGLVWLGSSAKYPGDERYYTDAALRMLERGEWWTPVYADGTVRANKPLLAYWVVMASFASAGVSLVVARLPFLLAGAAVVWLTGRLARVLFAERAAAGIAALAIAANFESGVLATRSTPDVLLVLGATASLYGLARVRAGERSPGALAWFWLGGAGALAAKGGLGALVLGFGMVVTLAVWKVRPVRALFPIPVCAGALVIAGLGLGPSLVLEARAGAPSFLDDQVGARLAGSAGEVLGQLVAYAGSLARHLLPWIALGLVAVFVARDAVRARWRAERGAFLLALSWAALLVVVFSCSNTHRGRYLAPAHPILCAALAPLLVDLAHSRAGSRVLIGVGCALGVVLLAAAVLVARLDVPTALGFALALGLGAVAWVGRDRLWPLRALALALAGLYLVGARGLSALVDPSPFPIVVRALGVGDAVPGSVATLGLPESAASQMRILSGAGVDPVTLPPAASDAEVRRHPVVVVGEAEFDRLAGLGYRVETVAVEAQNLTPRTAWGLFGTRELPLEAVWNGARIGVARSIGNVR